MDRHVPYPDAIELCLALLAISFVDVSGNTTLITFAMELQNELRRIAVTKVSQKSNLDVH